MIHAHVFFHCAGDNDHKQWRCCARFRNDVFNVMLSTNCSISGEEKSTHTLFLMKKKNRKELSHSEGGKALIPIYSPFTFLPSLSIWLSPVLLEAIKGNSDNKAVIMLKSLEFHQNDNDAQRKKRRISATVRYSINTFYGVSRAFRTRPAFLMKFHVFSASFFFFWWIFDVRSKARFTFWILYLLRKDSL